MKNILLVFLLFTGFLVLPMNSLLAQAWTDQNSGIDLRLHSVSVVDDQIAWTVGQSGIVLRTTNGGIVWQSRTPLPAGDNAYNVAAIDSNIALVCTNSDTGFIYRTSNGGNSWTRVYATSDMGFMNAVYMTTSTLGYALGDPVAGQWVLLKTTNAGVTWSSLPSLHDTSGEWGYNNCFEWTSSSRGWFSTNVNKIYRTTNSGASWTESVTPGYPDIVSIKFAANLGIAGQLDQTLRSTNYGVSWTPGGTAGTGWARVSYTDIPTPAWWAASLNSIYKSTDHGVSWVLTHSRNGIFRHIMMQTHGSGIITGYAVGDTGQISRYTDYFKTGNPSISNGSWSNPSTWLYGVPQPWHDVEVNHNVYVDALPNDSINGLNIWGTLTFDSTAGMLKIAKDIVFLELGASLIFPSGSYSGTGLKFYGHLVDSGGGIISPGSSEIISAGNNKTIYGNKSFNILEILGNNTSTIGDLTILKRLIINDLLNQSPYDTIFIYNDNPGALQGSGKIPQGTIVREITAGLMNKAQGLVSSGRYRFESENSFIEFTSADAVPTEIAMTTYPNDPIDTTLRWELLEGDTLGGVVNVDSNFVEIDSLQTFSTIRYVKPGGALNKKYTIVQYEKSVVAREYKIELNGGSNFKAKLRLRYDGLEVDVSAAESDLKLARGPVPTYTLTINIEGDGNVTKNPDKLTYLHGTLVELNALPECGYIFSGWSGDTSGTTKPLTIIMDENKNITATFTVDPDYEVTYRTATYADWASAVDGKGKFKAVKRKNDKVRLKFNFIVPDDAAGFKIKFGMPVTGAVTQGKDKLVQVGDSVKNAKEAIFSGLNLAREDTLQFDGFGWKGKKAKVKVEWKDIAEPVLDLIVVYKYNDPQLPMPNLHNVGEELFPSGFGQTSPYFAAGLVVGIPQDEHGRSSVQSPKYKDVMKSLWSKNVGIHDVGIQCFDEYPDGKEFTKYKKSYEPKKKKNELFAELLTLKLNVAASATEKFPVGFGELTFMLKDEPDNPFNGQTITQIILKADSLISCLPLASKTPVPTLSELYEVLHMLNGAFNGDLDTISFAVKTKFTGVEQLINVPFLRKTLGAVPINIAANPYAAAIPTEYGLYQSYPNPFNPTTMIEFALPEEAIVTLKVYNTLGQEVAILLNDELMDEGIQEYEFDASNLPSGVYFYRMVAQGLSEDEDGNMISGGRAFVSVKKMLLIK